MYDKDDVIRIINGIRDELGEEFLCQRNIAHMDYQKSGNKADKTRADTWNDASEVVWMAITHALERVE